ncbi:hypothetical protein PN482_17565 [Microcystis aeruginosa CS-555/01A07]|uniref:hypothetical protein n=1 Tax=Microcystis aeruginosa TaxID=1126 RepID=UPI00232AFE57|nr:hypothetical protein [Microcystis aeruginosa]MDB9430652.1 hypothetical protein [Microcystis aeruginosa CS-555/01A07]
MPITAAQLKTIVTGDESARAESLRTILNYPVLERDSQGSRFWYLRPGGNPEDAAETCPIAGSSGFCVKTRSILIEYPSK